MKHRLVALDCLRALAIVAVVFYHYTGFSYGLYGVTLFFVLSGYFILASAQGSAGSWSFYASRISRLMPALIVCGAATILAKQLLPMLPDRAAGWQDYFATLFALPTLNVFSVDFAWPDGAYWSLAIEFRFYALVAFLLLVRRAVSLPAALALSAGALTVLDMLGSTWFMSPLTPYMPCFLAGVALREALGSGKPRRGACLLAVAFALALVHLAAGISDPSIPTTREGVVALTLCVLLVALAVKAYDRFAGKSASVDRLLDGFAFVGLVSYPLYLLHQDLGYWTFELLNRTTDLHRHGVLDTVVRALLMPLLVLLAAAGVYASVEKPLRRRVDAALTAAPDVFAGLLGKLLSRRLAQQRAVLAAPATLLAAAAVFMLVSLGVRLQQQANTSAALGVLRATVLGTPTRPQSTPWGMVATTDGAQFRTIDLSNVPFATCAQIVADASKLPGVTRLATSTHATDEIASPVSRIRSELACFGLKRRTIRVITARQPTRVD